MSPESLISWKDMTRFIRSIARVDLTESDKAFILKIAEQAGRFNNQANNQWEHLAGLASFNHLEPFLYYHIKSLGLRDHLPGQTQKSLAETYYRTKKATLEQIDAVHELVSKAEQSGIQVMALQGLALKKTVYNDPGLRGMGDIDLMVKPEDKNRFRELVVESGYLNKSNLFPDLFDKGFIQVDIHTHILNLDRIRARRFIFSEDLIPMWDSALKTDEGLYIPDFHDNIIALAAHALKHGYARLIWLTDINECLLICSREPKGWDILIERARFWRQEKILLYALILGEKILNSGIPLWVKKELGLRDLNFIEKHYLRLKAKEITPRSLPHVLWLQNIDTMDKKIKYLKEVIFPKDNVRQQILANPAHRNWKQFSGNRILDIFYSISLEIRSMIESIER